MVSDDAATTLQPNDSRHQGLMKQYTKCLGSALAMACGLMITSPAQAQYTTNVLTDFHNFNLSATYANWNVDGSDPLNGGSGFTPVITSGPLNYSVQAQGYGSGAYDFASPVSLPGATMFLFTFTINHPMIHGDSTGLWFGPNLDISDGTHMVHLTAANAGGGYLSYGPYVGPGTYTLIGSLADQFGGPALDTTTITAFNLEVDPAEYGGGAPYSITYQSLALITPVPEPTSLTLLGMGGVALAMLRRRSKLS